MKQLSLSRMVAVACILCASSAGAMAAQNSKHGSDPARWYKADSTEKQRMQVLKTELNAAYAQQKADCKKKKSSKQSACLREARANFERDSANSRQLVDNAPQSTVTERVVSVTPAGNENGMQAGGSAYGSSGATGQTGAGAAPAANGAQQSGAPQTGAEQSGAAGYGSSQSMGASTPPTQGVQSGAQSGYSTSGTQSGYSSSAAGATGAGTNQSGAPVNGPTQSGSMNSNGSQSGTSTSQSMGAGTGATQSDTQDQQRAGAVPPVQR
jgi:hypothetical protein